MKKYKFDEQNGLWYELHGDYYLPCLSLPEGEKDDYFIGKYGRMRESYLKENLPKTYFKLRTSGELHKHLKEVDVAAKNQVEQIVKSMAQAEGCDENLKATNQMKWVGLMNNYKACAEEVVIKSIVLIVC